MSEESAATQTVAARRKKDTRASLRVLGLAAQQIDCVWNQLCYGFQRLHRAGGATRQIQDKGTASHAAHTATQRGEWSLLEAFTPHALRYPVEQLVTNRHGGFRRYIAGGNPGSAGGHDESDLACQANQQVLNWDGIVGNYFSRGDGKV